MVFGLSSAADPEDVDLLVLGYMLMGAGGCLAFMCTFPVSFLFPEKQGQVLAMTNCLFDASSALFLGLQLLHGWDAQVFSRRHWFIATAVLAAATFAGLTFSWSCSGAAARFSQMKLDNSAASADAEEVRDKDADKPVDAEPVKQQQPIWERSVRQQLSSAEFLFLTIFCAVHITKSTSFLGINKMILIDLGDADATYLAIFTALLPVSVVFVPLIGWVVDGFGLGGALHCVNGLGAAYAVCSLVPSLRFQLVTFAVYTTYRVSLHATHGHNFVRYASERLLVNTGDALLSGVCLHGDDFWVEQRRSHAWHVFFDRGRFLLLELCDRLRDEQRARRGLYNLLGSECAHHGTDCAAGVL